MDRGKKSELTRNKPSGFLDVLRACVTCLREYMVHFYFRGRNQTADPPNDRFERDAADRRARVRAGSQPRRQKTAGISSAIAIAQSGTVAAIKVKVDIEHPFIGDLRVALTSPAGRSTVLHPRLGGSADNLIATYDSATPGILGDMIGQAMMGNWTLNASDRARRDIGKLRSWSIDLNASAARLVLAGNFRR